MPSTTRKILFASIFAASLCSSILSAQSSGISMPSISMPTISAGGISVGGNSVGSNSTSNQSSPSGTSSTSSKTGTSSDSSTTKSSVTANDLSTISKLGALDTLSSLLGDGSSSNSSYLSSLYGSTNSNTTNLLLEQILKELEEVKEKAGSAALAIAATGDSTSGGNSGSGGNSNSTENASNSDLTTSVKNTADQNAESTTEESGATQKTVVHPYFLRFTVNGYNILNTCTRVYISVPEADGTFLVTGDRRYTSDGKIRTETFHILFRAVTNSGGLNSYEVASAVSQDYLNEYSFLYQLAQRKNLTATRTGNLVTMRTTDANWKLELLIDLGTVAN